MNSDNTAMIDICEALRSADHFGFNLRFAQRVDNSGKLLVVNGYTFTSLDRGECIPPTALLNLSLEAGRDLMDSLWQLNIRPRGFDEEMSKGLAAHLKDVRELAFLALKKDLE